MGVKPQKTIFNYQDLFIDLEGEAVYFAKIGSVNTDEMEV